MKGDFLQCSIPPTSIISLRPQGIFNLILYFMYHDHYLDFTPLITTVHLYCILQPENETENIVDLLTNVHAI